MPVGPCDGESERNKKRRKLACTRTRDRSDVYVSSVFAFPQQCDDVRFMMVLGTGLAQGKLAGVFSHASCT